MAAYQVDADSGGYSGGYADAGSHNSLAYYSLDSSHLLYFDGTNYQLADVLDAGAAAAYENGGGDTEPQGYYDDVTGTGNCTVGLIVPPGTSDHLLRDMGAGSIPGSLYASWGIYQGGTPQGVMVGTNYGAGSNGWNLLPYGEGVFDPIVVTVPEGAAGWYIAYWLDFNTYTWRQSSFYVGEDPSEPPPASTGNWWMVF